MTITVRVKNGRMMTIRQIEHDSAQNIAERDFSPSPDRSTPHFSKSKKEFSAQKNRPLKDRMPEGNRVGDIKRLDARGKLTPEERVTRLVEMADKFGEEYLRNELQIHKRKVLEIEEALTRHKNARVDRGLQKLADKIEQELNPFIGTE